MKDPTAAARREPRTVEPADFVVGRRMGSFTDYEAANRLVNATLLRNRERVDRLVGTSLRETNLTLPLIRRPERKPLRRTN